MAPNRRPHNFYRPILREEKVEDFGERGYVLRWYLNYSPWFHVGSFCSSWFWLLDDFRMALFILNCRLFFTIGCTNCWWGNLTTIIFEKEAQRKSWFLNIRCYRICARSYGRPAWDSSSYPWTFVCFPATSLWGTVLILMESTFFSVKLLNYLWYVLSELLFAFDCTFFSANLSLWLFPKIALS